MSNNKTPNTEVGTEVPGILFVIGVAMASILIALVAMVNVGNVP